VQVEPLRRLTNAQYANTVRDLLGASVKLTTPLDPDSSSGGFRVGGSASEAASRTYRAAAIELAGQAITQLPQLLPCMPAAGAEAACASQFIDKIGPRAYRRPLEDAQKTSLTRLYTTVAARYDFATGIQAILEAILQSPAFLYHLELDEAAKGPGVVPVTGYSMSSRLSYLLWATMPDDMLRAKAAANQLGTKAEIEAEARRLLADPKAKDGARNFYQQWLHLLEIPVSKNGMYAALYTPEVATSIRDSFDAQINDALWMDKDSLTTLLTGRIAFVNAAVAPLFGLTATGTALTRVTVDAKQRAGVLTHPALMALEATDTASHPIKRGVFMWDRILCQPLPDPPANVPPFTPPPPGVSTRQQFEHLTMPATCQACHVRINPIGFVFESYDTIGRLRTTDDVGQPVNTAVTVTGTGDLDGPLASATEFADRASKSASSTACLVSHLYRFTAKRDEINADPPVTEALAMTFSKSGQNLRELLTALTQTEVFLNRRNEP
ncbi:MAG TPA: DUF1588 domain-containing protein, partial [Polyangia bacterium]|nr:DUF1588 domain-containing protein [Polyangia bacterium]